MSGSAQHVIEQMVTQRRSAFFDHFDLLRLGPLPSDAATELLRRVAGRELEPEAAEAALAVVGGHPFCLHALGDALAGGAERVTVGEIKGVVQDLLFSSDGRLALHFEQSWRELVGRASVAAAVVERLADGGVRLTDVARELGLATGSVATVLLRLGEAVRKGADGRYSLVDPVFALWLRWRAPLGAAVPMRVLGDEGERRAADALVARGFDLVYPSRGSRGAFDLLALRGGRTLGVQVKRHRGRPRLTRAEVERMEAGAARMAVRYVVAAVAVDGAVRFLAGDGEIENLPRWFDGRD